MKQEASSLAIAWAAGAMLLFWIAGGEPTSVWDRVFGGVCWYIVLDDLHARFFS